MALHLLGYAMDHPVIKAASPGWTVLDRRATDGVRRLEACQSPVWDTALAVVALADAGLAPGAPARGRRRPVAGGRGGHRPGDWAVQRPKLAPGGWAFEFDNDIYPDTDDTAEVVLALLAAPAAVEVRRRRRGARPRGVALGPGYAVAPTVPGARSTPTTRNDADEAAVLRLRRGGRPAVGGRHRARRRDDGRRGQADDPVAQRGVGGCWTTRSATVPGSAGGV